MRYLIVEKTRGLFLGSFRSVSLFAKDNIFSIIRVPSFDTEADAEYYIANYLMAEDRKYGVIKIDTKEKYVSVIDILKAGYSEYTHNLIDFLPMPSEAVH